MYKEMQKELEAKFFIKDKSIIRNKLSLLGINLLKKEFLMKRKTFNSDIFGKWFRVRDEGDKITMTYKNIVDSTINGVNEIEIIVDNFNKASELINQTNFKETSYQENFREIWGNEDVEIVIDTWPNLNTYIEIEAGDVEIIKKYSTNLDFNYENDAFFGSVDVLYNHQYNIPKEEFVKLKTIIFNDKEFFDILKSYKLK